MSNKLYSPLLIHSVKACEALKANRFLGFDGQYCKSGKKALGIIDASTEKDQMAPIAITGILLIEAAENINCGDAITSDGYGRAIKLGSGSSNGIALDDGAKGQLIRIIRGI